MKKIFLGLLLLTLSTVGHAGVMSPNVSISSTTKGDGAWIVIDGEVYFCGIAPNNEETPKYCTHFILPEADGSSWTGGLWGDTKKVSP